MRLADYYSNLNVSFIPLNGKIPIFKWEEYQNRRPTPEEIQEWKHIHPDSGIGIITGPISSLLVLDIDGDAGKIP